MTTEKQDIDSLDFISAVGQEFASALSLPVPFEMASPHECYEAVTNVLGDHLTPKILSELNATDFTEIARSFSEWFECDTVEDSQVRQAIAGVLERWPVETIGANV